MLLINPMKTVFVYGRRGRWGHWTARAMINHTETKSFIAVSKDILVRVDGSKKRRARILPESILLFLPWA
jgi:SpoVK/Ycf46/Vps4 family AAA+-type ATPase